jgi:hypothetical protein
MSGIKLKITSPTMSAKDAVVEIDDVDVTNSIMAIDIAFDAAKFTTATVKYLVRESDIETLAEVLGDDK